MLHMHIIANDRQTLGQRSAPPGHIQWPPSRGRPAAHSPIAHRPAHRTTCWAAAGCPPRARGAPRVERLAGAKFEVSFQTRSRVYERTGLPLAICRRGACEPCARPKSSDSPPGTPRRSCTPPRRMLCRTCRTPGSGPGSKSRYLGCVAHPAWAVQRSRRRRSGPRVVRVSVAVVAVARALGIVTPLTHSDTTHL